MYEEYFNLAASPFRLNPDPKFFFGSRSHNKAMAYLHYGLRQAEGFIVITGEVGAGKSMLIGHLLDQLDRTNIVAANLITSNLEPSALLSHVLSAFRIEPANSGKTAELEAFEDFLFDQMNRGRRVLLIVDEAQNLPASTIEELRMLSNMDYDGTPLFQVFLVGQPEFRSVLAKPDMEQFRQRVIATYHLEPLTAEETKHYILHRLSVAGWADNPSIADDAYAAIFSATNGVPRKINTLCNRLFLYCALEKKSVLDAAVVEAVRADLSKEAFPPRSEQPDDMREAAERKERAELQEAVMDEDKAEGEEPLRAAAGGSVVVPFGGGRKSPAGDRAEPALEADREASPRDEAAPPQAAETAPAAASEGAAAAEDAHHSVFDRLRARRQSAEKSVRPRAPAAATLSDVAEAIAAVSDASPHHSFDDDEDEDTGELSEWQASLAKAIRETREELKAAHHATRGLRRALAEREAAAAERRARASEKIARISALIAERRSEA